MVDFEKVKIGDKIKINGDESRLFKVVDIHDDVIEFVPAIQPIIIRHKSQVTIDEIVNEE